VYAKYGERYFIVDGHIHFWDASSAHPAIGSEPVSPV
jgi:hypothetical protein